MRFKRVKSYVCLRKKKVEKVIESSLQKELTFSLLELTPRYSNDSTKH